MSQAAETRESSKFMLRLLKAGVSAGFESFLKDTIGLRDP